ncbi:MAG: ABC transporter permease, partial [Caulobacterales bacterium]|nr:ABC transporter permease [Caulobacterales bacterium]
MKTVGTEAFSVDPRDVGGAPPFGRYERMIAWRYLRARRAHGGVALISIISFFGIMLAVAVLIIVMSVMNGFRDTLLSTILGVEAHAYVFASDLAPETVEEIAERVERAPGVTRVAPVIQGQAMTSANDLVSGAVVYGMRKEDLEEVTLVAGSITDPAGRGSGSLERFGEGRNGGDQIVIGRGLANSLGLRVGDRVTLIAPSGAVTAFGTTPRRKAYEIAATFFVGNTNYDSQIAFLPLDQAQLFFNRGEGVDHLEVRVQDPDNIDKVIGGIRTAAAPFARVNDWRDRQGAFFNALKVERFMMRLILMLLVVIAALNIISGLVMLAKNKSRDIAILRTIGATKGGILRVFFLA